jgi:leucine-rich PPR motif-containing protein, mitochondrial
VRAGRIDVAARLVSRMEANGFPSCLLALSVLLKGYGRARRPDDVRRILRVCRQRGLQPDVIFLNSAIDALVRCGDLTGARQILTREFLEYGIERNHLSFHPILRGLARSGRVKDVHRIYHHMITSGIQPDDDSLNALISACVHSQDFEGARQLLRQALNSPQTSRDCTLSATGDTASVPVLTASQCVAYTTVISGLAVAHCMEEALDLLDELVERFRAAPSLGVELQVAISVSAVLSAVLKQQDSDRALKLFNHTRSHYRIRSTPDTHKALVRGLCNTRDRASIDAASEILEEMCLSFASCQLGGERVGENKVPVGSSKDNVALIAGNQSDMAQGSATASSNTASALFAAPVSVDDMIAAFNIMIDGYARIDDMVCAEKLLARMKREGFSPDVVTFTSIIAAYGRSQNMVEARRTFLEMRARRILPDKIAMNAFIGACVNCRDRELAVLIFDEMQRVGGHMSPDLTTFSAMIALYIRVGDVGAAWDAYEELKALGFVPNERIIDRMMDAFVSRKSDHSAAHGPLLGVDASVASAALRSAIEEYQAHARDTDLGEELAICFDADEKKLGWNSDRVALLLQDMERINVPERTRVRWREALSRAWSA